MHLFINIGENHCACLNLAVDFAYKLYSHFKERPVPPERGSSGLPPNPQQVLSRPVRGQDLPAGPVWVL